MSAIALENVSLSFAAKPQPFTVLEEINLTLDKGEFVVLLGPSGCGKSTILNLVAGFTKPDSGRVLASGKPVQQPGPERGMIFQQPNLFPWLSVLDNVTFGPRLGRYQKEEVNARALDWLNRVGLKGFEQHAPWQLSGGMKQRVALARAWLPGPSLITG
jgi:NitT/TauT family transport system ATP-binding protein